MENEKLGFSVDRVKRDRRWWKMESKSGISEHHHQQSWSEAGATEPSSQLQVSHAEFIVLRCHVILGWFTLLYVNLLFYCLECGIIYCFSHVPIPCCSF